MGRQEIRGHGKTTRAPVLPPGRVSLALSRGNMARVVVDNPDPALHRQTCTEDIDKVTASHRSCFLTCVACCCCWKTSRPSHPPPSLSTFSDPRPASSLPLLYQALFQQRAQCRANRSMGRPSGRPVSSRYGEHNRHPTQQRLAAIMPAPARCCISLPHPPPPHTRAPRSSEPVGALSGSHPAKRAGEDPVARMDAYDQVPYMATCQLAPISGVGS